MPPIERRRDLARRLRCRVLFGWLTRSEKWLTLVAKIMRTIAIIVGAISVLGFIFTHFGETPKWLIDILSVR